MPKAEEADVQEQEITGATAAVDIAVERGRRIPWRMVAILVVTAGLVLWATREAYLPFVADFVSHPEATFGGAADAVVVLAGDDGRLSEGFRIRKQGLARELWETGASGAVATERNAYGFVYRALPSSTTWEDALQIRQMASERGAKRLIVVTSWYHGRRAMRTIEKHTRDLNVEILYRAAPTEGYDRSNWWRDESGRQVVKAEFLKSVYYLFVYGVWPL